MELGFKKRLIGAIVILLLAVVVLPQVFDGSGRIPDRVTAIPPVFKKPDVSSLRNADRSNYAIKELPEAFNISMQPVDSTASQVSVNQVVISNTSIAAEVAILDEEPELTIKSNDILSDEISLPSRLEPVEAPKLSWQGKRAQVFSIQVGSFSDESNANKLLARVREAGFKAYLITNLTKGRSMSQVLVGPVASIDRANQVAQQLKAISGVSTPWVMKYKAATNITDTKK